LNEKFGNAPKSAPTAFSWIAAAMLPLAGATA
jgi:hypothetical protein